MRRYTLENVTTTKMEREAKKTTRRYGAFVMWRSIGIRM